MNEIHASTALTPSAKVSVREGVLFQQLQDEAVLLNLDSGQYFGLDPVGTRIWNLLVEEKALPEVVSTIVAEYKVEGGRCEADLLKLLADLETQGLVSVIR